MLLVASPVSAHQPRVVNNTPVTVIDPEVSKAYYAQLKGQPDIYTFRTDKTFNLYVNVLVPDIAGQTKQVSAQIVKDGKEVKVLDGLSTEWKKFDEPFGHDTYWMGPEYRDSQATAGNYEIKIFSPNNDSKYSLAIGEIEAFDAKESINALLVIPQLKKNFFNKSPIDFILSPFGIAQIVILFVLAFVIGFLYRFILRKITKSQSRKLVKNLGKSDRLLRLAIGAGLLLLAITTSWSPILIFFAGFAFFEAIFSWCGFYAAIGKNTCPL